MSLASLAAHATVYDVSATLKYGGTLSGTIDLTGSTVTGYDIIASAGPGSPGFTFPGFTYTPSDSSVTASTSTLIQFDSTTPAGEELRLKFASALGGSSDSLTTSGYESEIVAGNRSIMSGSITAAPANTPEPSSFLLLGTGLLTVVGAVKRRFI
jgi:hypothetical protein